MSGLRNAARGEVLLAINGEDRRLCVTLGALAELEAAFDVASFTELGERLAHLTASDLIIVLSALTIGGGAGMSGAEIAAAQVEPRAAAEAVARAFKLAFDDEA